ncbi:MAG: NlpC/P60 family protein [Bacteroidetes bacterium]|nr:MAG: NlpC/P60 family protein [Bacteroidota bacterium]
MLTKFYFLTGVIASLLFSGSPFSGSPFKTKTKTFAEKKVIRVVDTLDHFQIEKTAKEWVGTRYRYGSNSKKGTDCSGFTGKLYEEVFNLGLHRGSLGMFEDKNINKVKKEDLRAGDLVFFVTRGKRVSHVGVYLKNNKFAHASTYRGVIISDLNEAYYKKRFAGAARHKSLALRYLDIEQVPTLNEMKTFRPLTVNKPSLIQIHTVEVPKIPLTEPILVKKLNFKSKMQAIFSKKD